jgi:hypothetical protein
MDKRTMAVRVLVGPYKGQVLEHPQHIAEHLLDVGYAELPGEADAAAPVMERATLPVAETPEGLKPRRRRA